jgi:hypothetical protein
VAAEEEKLPTLVKVLISIMGGGVLLGVILGITSDYVLEPYWLSDAAGILVVSSLALPVWIAAIAGGRLIHRYGWIPGLLLVPAIAAAVILTRTGEPQLAAIGVGAVVVVIALFFLLGYRGGAPMWLSPAPGVRGTTLYEGDPEKQARQRGQKKNRTRKRKRN